MRWLLWVSLGSLLPLFTVCILNACSTLMSPKDMYRSELLQCQHQGSDEAVRQCESMVDKKYGRYLHEGEYP